MWSFLLWTGFAKVLLGLTVCSDGQNCRSDLLTGVTELSEKYLLNSLITVSIKGMHLWYISYGDS